MTKVSKIRREGYEAFGLGFARAQNPHKIATMERRYWDEGYKSAQDEFRYYTTAEKERDLLALETETLAGKLGVPSDALAELVKFILKRVGK